MTKLRRIAKILAVIICAIAMAACSTGEAIKEPVFISADGDILKLGMSSEELESIPGFTIDGGVCKYESETGSVVVALIDNEVSMIALSDTEWENNTKISIGDSKEDVEKAYKDSLEVQEDNSSGDSLDSISVEIDGVTQGISFYYDNEGNVNFFMVGYRQ